MERTKTSKKEEFFRRFKPAVDSKVVTEEGKIVTSETVLVLIKELKQFIEKGDVNGYCNFLENNPKEEALNDDDCQSLWSAKITSGGLSVFQLYSDLLDRDN